MSDELGAFAEGSFGSEGITQPSFPDLQLQAARQIAQAATLSADNVVVLAEGQTIQRLEADGTDLVIILTDGTRIVVPDGVIIVPQIIVGGTPIPPANVAALLAGNEPEPEAGPNPSSGGNFAVNPDNIQAAFDLGDLLPYTELPNGVQFEEEVIPVPLEDEEVFIFGLDGEGPEVTLDEDDLADGSDRSGSTTATGSFSVDAKDGLESLQINGEDVVSAGAFVGPVEVANDGIYSIIITGWTPVVSGGRVVGASFNFTATLLDNTREHNQSGEDSITRTLVVTAQDVDGSAATASIEVRIVDDVADASDDVDTIPGATFGPATGNVITDAEQDGGRDMAGADGITVTAAGISATSLTSLAQGALTINGTYGVLTINANGSYSYTRNPGTPGGVRDAFTYRIVDGDGDTDTAVLNIAIEDVGTRLSVPGINDAGTLVDEAGLPTGSNAAANSETTSGTITFQTFDGFGGLTINGEAITMVGQTIAGQFGTLTITGISNGAITYSYALTTATQGNATSETFAVAVSDLDGDTSSATLIIAIVDDVPSAINDTDTIPSATFGPATGNVVTDSEGDGGADTPGADGITVTAAGTSSGNLVTLSEGSLVINGTYGVLTIKADGSYSYTRNVNTPGGVTEVFTYQVTDGDGDTDTATLTIAIEDAQDTITFVPETGDGTVVREPHLPGRDGEPAGSSFDGNAEATNGTITFKSPDGVASVTLAGVVVTPNALPQTIVSDSTGRLVVTAYSYNPATGEGSITYTYTLNDNTLDPDGTNVPFDIVVVDLDGDIASDTVTIEIIDDVPTAANDTDSLTEDGPVFTSGNVITDAEANGDNGADVTGADGAVVQTPGSLSGAYGTLVLNADGSYTYTLSAFGVSQVSTLGAGESFTEVFEYVLVDGDGDTSPATLTLTLNGADDGVTINGLDGEAPEAALDEDDLANQGDDQGSDQSDSTTVTGSFGVTSPDGLGDVQVNGVNVVVNGAFVGSVEVANDGVYAVSITGWTPVFAADGVTVISATFSYSASLLDNTLEHDTLGQDDVVRMLTVTADDSDGSSDSASLDVQIIDDAPSIDVTAGSDAGVVLTTQDAETDGNPTDTDTAISAAQFGGVFALSFATGADGAATPSLGYVLSVTDAVSGLTSNGAAINLYLIGGKVVGSTAATQGGVSTGNTVFDLAVSSTGVVTLSQYQQVDHAAEATSGSPFDDQFAVLANGKIALTASSTITDGDGDTATDSATVDLGGNVRFADDGPDVTATGTAPTLTVDETDLALNASAGFAANFTTLFGADGSAASGSLVYTLGVVAGPSGLVDTLTGQNVILSLNGNVVEGRTAGSNALVFTVTVATDGTVTLDQLRAVVHTPDAGPDQSTTLSAANLVTLTATATDFDGDTDSATINIADKLVFKDDAPSIG